jgi:hypothetical protein
VLLIKCSHSRIEKIKHVRNKQKHSTGMFDYT